MRLSQLVQNSNLVLEININNQHLEFESTVITKIGDYILIEPVRVSGKVVNFEIGNVLVDMLLIRRDKKPVAWKRVLLKNVIYKNKTYYKVIPTGDGFEINRRNAFRLSVEVKGVVQVGTNSVPMDVILKDISQNGFLFVSKDIIDRPLKSIVRLVFIDLNKSLNLNGLLVRKERINQSKYFYGCVLNIKNQFLSQYMNDKNADMLSKQSIVITNRKTF
ncbi:PilZ domain-containing protein [[Clostridium] fimetarium]|uniref:PilZ domain-containing protein n=1 Tax=[Clostridium] fimetarium TaxID=99656 RepID=A0A1I0PY19_9FIRM|nr:PilZ domain-containing protein [[Clostridium] fimetarium]SEW19304.1 PilZ domain-containing protein [[Clostridium] fimetarium]